VTRRPGSITATSSETDNNHVLHRTYDARTADRAQLVEVKRMTDAHISVQGQQHGQPRVSGPEPVSSGVHPAEAIGVHSADGRRPHRLEYIGQK